MRWPFKEWGASVALAGHDHVYERLLLDGFPYLINGLGGGPIYYFADILEGSQVRYAADHGALLVIADIEKAVIQFVNRSGQVIDSYELLAGAR